MLKLYSILLFFTLCFSFNFSYAQGDEKFISNKDLVLTGGSFVGLGISYYVNQTKWRYTSQQLASLQSSHISAFDQVSLNNWSPTLAKRSDYIMLLSPGLGLTHLTYEQRFKPLAKIAFRQFQAALLNTAITYIIKESVQRTRPLVYNDNVDISYKQKANARSSFISGHTSFVACNSFFTAYTYCENNPDSPSKYLIVATSVALPVYTAYLRVKAGKHFKTDVIGGYFIGALTGIGLPYLYSKIKKKK